MTDTMRCHANSANSARGIHEPGLVCQIYIMTDVNSVRREKGVKKAGTPKHPPSSSYASTNP